MNNIIKKFKFKGKWRIYQQRVLEELSQHFSDKKLHVVAAPGAGKTTLGIEVIRLLGNPTLILSPTIVIKNQWKYRILDDFCPADFNANEISTDLENIKDITTGTYQRLQAIYKKGWQDEFIRLLKERGVKTLVLDEAHHLRTEWYKTLDKLIAELSKDVEDFKIVSLTATPPYDVEEKEWENYYNLCGAIDTEISIPELVQHKDLCPHQDLIYFSDLNKQEKEIVFDFKKNRDKFFSYLNKNSDFLYSIETSAFLNDLDKNFDLIYEDTDFTISIISYLFSIDSTHLKATELLGFLELQRDQIPTFNYSIAEDLFNGMFGKFKKHFQNIPTLKAKVKEHKLLKNASKVDFEGETNFRKLYARSQNKLSSIEAITKIEHETLGDELREVILLDYIGQDSGAYGLNIVSAFKLLDKNRAKNLKLGILTGSLVIIPKSTKPLFDKLIKEKNLTGKILCADYDENYYRVESYGDADVVALVTEFFTQGGINVLIGTHSLLGEGWDSPCINTLVIGSVVASFMLSNQMRGRALRVDKNNPNKTANIWHLIAVESKADKGFDFKAISKRFDTFDGLNYNHDGIESGIERLGLNFANYSPDKMEELNQLSIKRAINRKNLPQKWSRCLKSGKNDKNSKIYKGLSIITTEAEYIIFQKVFNPNCYITSWNKLLSIFQKNQAIWKIISLLGLSILLYHIFANIGFVSSLFWGIYEEIGLIMYVFSIVIFIVAKSVVLDAIPYDTNTISRLSSKPINHFLLKPYSMLKSTKTYIESWITIFPLLLLYLLYPIEIWRIILCGYYICISFYYIFTSIKIENKTASELRCYLGFSLILWSTFWVNIPHPYIIFIGLALFWLIFIIPILLFFYAQITIEYFPTLINKLIHKLSFKTPYEIIAEALLKTLCKQGKIETPHHKINLKIIETYNNNSSFNVNLNNVTYQEESIFRTMLNSLFSTKEKKELPLYILKLTALNGKNIIPPPAWSKDDIEFFTKELEKSFGEIELIETKTIGGKREMLKAKYNNFIQATAKEKRTWLPRK